MSNRILALLVLIGVFAGFILMYMYFFVYYTSSLTIRSNIGGYSVELYGKSVAQRFTHECPEEVCTISDISPLEYNMTISKDGYVNFSQNIDIDPRSKQEFLITLEKKVVLEKVDPVVVPEENIETQLTPQEKIAQIRQGKAFIRTIDLESGKKIGMKQKDGLVELYYVNEEEETLIDVFSLRLSSIRVQEVIGTPYITLFIGQQKYLWDSDSSRLSEFEIVPEIKYIKQGRLSTELVFITDKGAFIYSTISGEFEYFYFFKDFVYVDGGYVGVIYKDEEKKKQNYSFEEEEKNIIVRYMPDTQQRTVIYRTDLDVDRIYKEGEGVFFESEGEIYSLENY